MNLVLFDHPALAMPFLAAPRSFLVGAAVVSLVLGARPSEAQWRPSLQMGVTGSTLTGDVDTDFSAIARLSGGGNLSYVYRTGFAIQSGLHYVVKGAKADDIFRESPDDSGIPLESTIDLAYLEVPLFFGYVFQRRGTIHPRIFAGPVLAFNLDATLQYRAKSGGPVQQETVDTVTDRDLAIGAGLGVEWEIRGERLLLGLQSTVGLSNARSADPELYNRSLGFFTGIVF